MEVSRWMFQKSAFKNCLNLPEVPRVLLTDKNSRVNSDKRIRSRWLQFYSNERTFGYERFLLARSRRSSLLNLIVAIRRDRVEKKGKKEEKGKKTQHGTIVMLSGLPRSHGSYRAGR